MGLTKESSVFKDSVLWNIFKHLHSSRQVQIPQLQGCQPLFEGNDAKQI